MKTPRSFATMYQFLFLGAVAIYTVGCSSNKTLTRQDVKDDVTEAREATQEARQKTQKAIESREQYYADYRETRLQELENRSKEIDKKIRDMKKISKDSPNQQAVSNINSAILALQDEKSDLNRRIENVKALEVKDWSASYQEVDQAITRIEGELSKLSQSLEQR
jgi:chromosome segregation ATPase